MFVLTFSCRRYWQGWWLASWW